MLTLSMFWFPQNFPLYIRTVNPQNETDLQFQYLVHISIDVIEEKSMYCTRMISGVIKLVSLYCGGRSYTLHVYVDWLETMETICSLHVHVYILQLCICLYCSIHAELYQRTQWPQGALPRTALPLRTIQSVSNHSLSPSLTHNILSRRLLPFLPHVHVVQ